MDKLSICFSRNLFISPSSLNNNLARQNILDWKLFFFPFSTLKIACCSLLVWKVSIEKSADSIMGIPLYRHTSFYCASAYFTLCRYCIFYSLKFCGNPALLDDGLQFLAIKYLLKKICTFLEIMPLHC